MSGPHRYLFLLWEPPEGASNETTKSALCIKDTVGLTERLQWNEEEFEKKGGLGDVIAVNYSVWNST